MDPQRPHAQRVFIAAPALPPANMYELYTKHTHSVTCVVYMCGSGSVALEPAARRGMRRPKVCVCVCACSFAYARVPGVRIYSPKRIILALMA